jgi:hypothetical protein
VELHHCRRGLAVDVRRVRSGLISGLGARVVEGRRRHAERIERLGLLGLVVGGAQLELGVEQVARGEAGGVNPGAGATGTKRLPT